MFDFAKVDANYYENAINRFSNLNLQIPRFVNDDEYNWNAISEAIGSNDQRLLGYLQSLGNTTHSLDNMAASTEGLSAYLERTGQMYDTSAIKATLLNSALSGGIILTATLAVKGLSAAWDHFNVTAAEVQSSIDDTTARLSTLTAEYEELSSLDSGSLSDSEKERLTYLGQRIEKEQQLLNLQNTQKTEEEIGGKFTDLFDDDSYSHKLFSEKFGGINPFDLLSRGSIDNVGILKNKTTLELKRYQSQMNDIAALEKELSAYDKNSYEYQLADTNLTGKRQELDNKILPDLQEQHTTWMEKKFQYEDAISDLESDAKNPYISADSRNEAKQKIKEYQTLLNGANTSLEQLEDILYSPEQMLNSIDKRLDNFSADYLDGRFTDEEIEILFHSSFDKNATERELRSLIADAQEQADLNAIALAAKWDYTETLSQINTARDKFSTLGTLLNDINASGSGIDLENLEKISDAFSDTDGIEHYIKRMNEAGNDSEEVRKTMSELYNSYLESSGILDNLTEENIGLVSSFLEEIGVVDGAAMAQARLAAQTYATSQGYGNLSEATCQDINALLNLGTASEATRSYLAAYALEKLNASNTKISTEDDIIAIINLANAAGASASKIFALKQVLGLMDGSIESTTGEGMMAEKLQTNKIQNAGNLTAYIQQLLNTSAWQNLNPSDYINANGGNNTGSSSGNSTPQSVSNASKAAGNAADKVSDAAEKVQQSFYAVFDWMERKINTLERIAKTAIENVSNSLDYALDSKYVSGTFRKINDQMKQNAYMVKRYRQSADDSGLSEEWKTRIETGGTIDYSEIHDENLSKKIKEYEDWYKKSLACKDANEKLRDTVKEVAEAMAQAPIDKFASKIDKYKSKMELYDAQLDNAVTASEQNKYINKKINKINETQNAYKDAYNSTQKNVSAYSKKITRQKAAKNADKKQTEKFNELMKKVKSAANSKPQKKIGDKTLNAIYNYCASTGSFAWYENCEAYNAAVEANNSAKETCDLYKETARQEKADLAKQKFDNISNQYDYQMSANEQKKTVIQNQISLTEEQGQQVSTTYYQELIAAEEARQKKLIAKRDALQKSLNEAVAKGTIKEGSEEWYEMIDAINETTNAIDESRQSLVQYNNTIRQTQWDAFDKSMETLRRVNSEADFYINRMDYEDLTDKDSGNFTDYGNAALALHNVNYESYLKQSEAYRNEYNRIISQIRSGELSATDENVIARLRDLQDAQRNSVISAEDEKQAILSLVSDAYDKQLSSLSDLISKYKDLMNAEKDAYDYQRSIQEKVKNIAALQKQLDAYGTNADTEESRARIQQIKLQLEEAQNDLKDTQYDKYISDTNDILDELYDNFESFLDEKLDQTNELIAEIKSSLNSDDGKVIAVLNSLNGGISDVLAALLNKNPSEQSGETANADQNTDTSQLSSKQKPGGLRSPVFQELPVTAMTSDFEHNTPNMEIKSLVTPSHSTSDTKAFVEKKADSDLYKKRGRGDMVFTNEMSQRLWETAQMNPVQFTRDIHITPVLPSFEANMHGSDVNISFGDLTLPNVTNTSEFADTVENVIRNAICKNGKTTQCISEAVASKMTGKGIGNAQLYK